MAVYVDDFQLQAVVNGMNRRWSHLVADSPDELADFARLLGLRASWIQKRGTRGEHFDVTDGMRRKAIALGAEPISYFELHAVQTGAPREIAVSPSATPALW
ncbi:hypothetical protein GCM10027052_25810 [Parafrigoribacterium mesophilum]